MSLSLSDISTKVSVYYGTPMFIVGVVGEFLSILVSTSLRTFRESSCAFYLTIMSILNIGQLFTGLFSHILIMLFGFNADNSSLFYCKFRPYLFQICTGGSLMCFYLATFDQYCATCSRPRWQQRCNMKLAKRLVLINFSFWILVGIPYLILFVHIRTPGNQINCTSINLVFNQYRAYVAVFLLLGILPISISTLFGSLAYWNVQQLPHRTIPLVRRELDKQLTTMVLVQVVVNVVTLLPHTIINTLVTSPALRSNSSLQTILVFVVSITLLVYFSYFASPFYVFICASERFRRQLIYVLFKIHLNRCRQPTGIITIIQVRPEDN